MQNVYLSQNEVLKQTGLKYWQLEHLIKAEEIPVVKHGHGVPRKFPPEAVEILKEWLAKRTDSKK
ncbi:MAG: hypothetical protein PHC43_02070 [Candidatus Marinimicrobia bacterium]|nr:hypothetical protein [Candidatus Neomarinimicrobiota bacterium]